MTDRTGRDGPTPEVNELSQSLHDIARRSQRLVAGFLARNAAEGSLARPADFVDPLNVGGAFLELTTRMMADPAGLARAQMSLWQDYLGLWQDTARRMMGMEETPAATAEKGDRRFKDPAWEENEVFNFIKQSYLLTSRWMLSKIGRAHV